MPIRGRSDSLRSRAPFAALAAFIAITTLHCSSNDPEGQPCASESDCGLDGQCVDFHCVFPDPRHRDAGTRDTGVNDAGFDVTVNDGAAGDATTNDGAASDAASDSTVNDAATDGGANDASDGAVNDGAADAADAAPSHGHLTLAPSSGSTSTGAGDPTPSLAFALGNDGFAALTFAVSCTGAVASPSAGTIQPGGSSTVSLSLPTFTTPGTRNATCTATTSDGFSGPLGYTATIAVGPDVTAPTVTLTSPGALATLSDTASLQAATADAVGVTQVEFLADGVTIATATSAPFAAAWDTLGATNGSHTLLARARDAAGNVGVSSAVQVTVGNRGFLTLSPSSASTSVTVNKPTPSVSFTLGDSRPAPLTYAITCTGATPSPANGTIAGHGTAPITVALPTFTTTGTKIATCTAITSDGDGGPLGFTATVNVTASADTTPPTVTVSAPAGNATVSGSVAIAASANDDVAVTTVDFLVDGAVVGTASAAPYGATWDTTKTTNGAHTITAKAHDAAGNVGTSAPVAVTVANGHLTLAPSTATISAITNQPTPGTSFTLGNDGAGSLAFSVSCTGATPGTTGGTIAAAGGAGVSVALPTFTTPGAKTATCTATTSNGTGGPLTFTATVNVSSGPIAITRPTPGTEVCARILLESTASSSSVTQVRYALDGATLGTSSAGPGFHFMWDSSTTANGSHAITAIGLDASNNPVGAPDTSSITVGNGDNSSGACTSLHLTMGVPDAISSHVVTNVAHFLMNKFQYSHSYNSQHKTPNWVAWELDDGWDSGSGRSNNFRADDTLPVSIPQASLSDYSEPVYDRGHMCPSADRETNDPADNSATFYLTNMVPQAPKNNQLTWNSLEGDERTLASGGKAAFIYSGPLYEWLSPNPIPKTLGTSGVDIPSATWKVIVLVDEVGMGPQDLTTDPAHTRVISVVVPNCWGTDSTTPEWHPGCPYTQPAGANWKSFCTTVRHIESRTGLNFFSDAPRAVQDVIETQLDAACLGTGPG